MIAVMEIEPRTSMERHLMDRDREGQLYLEARRQQAAQDLLANRTSFLSTITPPSTNPPSTASSIYREPNSSSSSSSETGREELINIPIYPSSLPTTVMSSTTTANNTITHNSAPTPNSFLSTHPPVENIPSSKQSSRKRSASQSRVPVESNNRPLLPISPSSLEYQLTANLLSYHRLATSSTTSTSAPASVAAGESRKPRSRSRSRSKHRSQKSRRPTASDTQINTKISTTSSTTSSSSKSSSKNTTGHKQSGSHDSVEAYGNFHKDQNSSELNNNRSHTTIEELTPTSLLGSIPSSPIDFPSTSSYYAFVSRTAENSDVATSPPLPPKSPKSLIAHYFPGSLPPPPSRGRAPAGPKELIIAPTPFKTPTFGPASILSSSFQDNNAPPLPSPSHFNFIPSANVSRCTITPIQESDLFPSDGRPSPCTSALGFSAYEKPHRNHPNHNHNHNHNATTRLASDLDLFGVSSNRGRFHNQPQRNNNFGRNQPINNFSMHDHTLNTNPAENPITLTIEHASPPSSNTSNITPATSSSNSNNQTSNNNNININGGRGRSPTTMSPVSPIYPRGLMSSADPLDDNSLLRTQQKAIPYIRDLVPGKEDASQTLTPNISHDLQIVIEEATGRLRTNRTSLDPWPYYISPWDEKSLPSARKQNENKYWVFRDQEGIIPGPYLFIFGHFFPILWWIGCVYPRFEHPDNIPERDPSVMDTRSNYNSNNNSGFLHWLRSLFRFFISMKSSSAAMASQEFSRKSQETDREGSTIAPPPQTNINTIPPPIQAPSLDAHGPWSAEDNATSSLFEQRLEHDRKVLRFKLTQRWKKINLIWSIGTFVIAIVIASFTYGFRPH